MYCQKCGTQNPEGSVSCSNCGANLNPYMDNNTAPVNNEQIAENNNQPVEPQVVEPTLNQNVVTGQELGASPVTNQVEQNSNEVKPSTESLNFFKYIALVLIKPFKRFKENEDKLSSVKNSIILSSIVAAIIMLINILNSMVNSIFTKTFDLKTLDYKTVIDFANIKNLRFFPLIWKNILISTIIVATLAGSFYLISLIFKKKPNFLKLLSISSTALVPYIAANLLALFSDSVYTTLSGYVLMLGQVYGLMVLLTLVGEEVTFENKGTKLYYYAICVAIAEITIRLARLIIF